MPRALALALLAGALVLAAAAPGARAQAVTPAEARALGQEAFLYGFPLLELLRVRATATSVRCPDGQGNAPVNAFSTARGFATPADRTVVAPNVDTLYSIAHLDLGRGPVVLRHPDMGRRYFVFQLLDAYTNTIGYVGTRTTGRRAGRFAITWRGARGGQARRTRGARRLVSPTRRVWVIGRTVASDRRDQRRALRLMRRYRLVPPGGARRFPRDCRPGRPAQARTRTGLAFLTALGTALRQNPPPARDRPLLARLARVGVGPGLRPDRAGLDPGTLAALVAGVTTTATALPTVVRSRILQGAAAGGGWSIPAANIGDYGTDYAYRAGVALFGLGANTPEEAVYPTAYTDGEGRTLDGGSRYRLVFGPGEQPPNRAFWSLTVYDADGYLVANPQDRYAVGSSHPPLVRRADGSVVIALQRTRPTERRVNWLPVPAGPFRLNLRIYRPARSVLAGDWRPPPVRRLEP
jgi:hypothetical protein